MLVTTTADPQPDMIRMAERLAAELGARPVRREHRSLRRQLAHAGTGRPVLIVGRQELRYVDESGAEFFFHPSMAMIRVKRLLAGETDAMLAAAGAKRGDRIIDCTMGLGSDAIVFAYAAGETGSVEALESEPIPFILAREGLRAYTCGVPELERAMRRVAAIREEHTAYLRTLPDKCADIVYFDPMFRRPAAGDALESLRAMANPAPLRPEAVEQAVRVARKTVVMKEHSRSGEFERLGFRPVRANAAKITYGVIRL